MNRSSQGPVDREYEFRMAEPSGDGRTMEGMVSVFNDWAQIHDASGTFRECVAPTAFTKSLIENPKPPVLYDHGQHPLIGSMPLGAIQTLTPRAKGLFASVRLASNWMVEPVREAISNGSISGCSFRFSVVKDVWGVGKDGTAERTLKEVKLVEIGPVLYPAYLNTSVSVRSRGLLSALEDPETRGELARALIYGTPTGAARRSARTRSQNRAIAWLSLNA